MDLIVSSGPSGPEKGGKGAFKILSLFGKPYHDEGYIVGENLGQFQNIVYDRNEIFGIYERGYISHNSQ